MQFVFYFLHRAYVVRMGKYRTYIVSFALSAEYVRKLDELSRSLGISRSRLVSEIVRKYIDEASARGQLPSVNNAKPRRQKLVLTRAKKVVVCDSCGYILAEVPLDVKELNDPLICPRCRSTKLSLTIILTQNDNPTNEQNTAH